MKGIQVNGQIKIFSSIPKVWTDNNGTHLNITDGEAFGFYDIITPVYSSATQELGEIYFDSENNTFTYPVVEKVLAESIDHYKSIAIANLKKNARKALEDTDWYELRRLARGIDIPDSIAASRATLLSRVQEIEDAINALNSKADVVSYDIAL